MMHGQKNIVTLSGALVLGHRKTKTEVRGQNLLKYHFVHHKSHGLAQTRSRASATNRLGHGRLKFDENSGE